MTLINNSRFTSPKILPANEDETFIYNGKSVKIITVFHDNPESTALVEDENGEIFQVPRNSLRSNGA